MKYWNWSIKIYVQLNDVSWGITYTYPLPHTQSFSSLAPKCIKPKPSKFHLLGLQILEYVKYFNRFQYLLILNLIIQHIQISKYMECSI